MNLKPSKAHLLPLLILLIVLSSCTMPLNTPDGSNGGPTGGNSSGGGVTSLPTGSGKQVPQEITFNGCPPEGDGGDPFLNINKNRVDGGNYVPTDFNTILNLPWPQEVELRAHSQWSASAQAEVAKYEGDPVSVQGYLALARQEGPETPNCHSSTDADYHIWLINHPGGSTDRVQSIVVEATPRVRVNHPGWTVARLNALAQAGTKVLISGWLMLDPEHPDQVGLTRGTIWEIHPVMEIDVLQNNQWVRLDDYR